MLIAAILSLISVGYAVRRVLTTPPQIIFDAEESIEYAAQALPDEVTSQISYGDLQRVLRLHLEWLQAFHWSPVGASKSPIVFDELEPKQYITERAEVIGLEIDTQYIESILASHYDYLTAVGAIHAPRRPDAATDLNSTEELTA